MPEMTISVSQEKYAKFKTSFLKSTPVPLDMDDNPTMSDAEWIRQCIRDYAQMRYRKGHDLLHWWAGKMPENVRISLLEDISE